MKKYLIAATMLVSVNMASNPVVPPADDSVFLVQPVKAPSPAYSIPTLYREMFEREAAAAGVPLWIVARMAEYESGFNPLSVNDRNANGTVDSGIMQLNSACLDDFAWKYNGGEAIDPFNPFVSVRVACRHLARLYGVTGSWVKAVASYNAGLGRMSQDRAMPEITERYLRFVFREAGAKGRASCRME